MTPLPEHVYLVQILAAVEVVAETAQEAKQIALDVLARRCERGQDMLVRADEIKH
jgi:hypothetical protein